MKKRVPIALTLLMLILMSACASVLATPDPSTWKREILIGDNSECYFTYVIVREHPPNYYCFSDNMYLCKYTIKNQELIDKILIASTLYEDVDANDTWTRRDTVEKPFNLGSYLIKNKVSYAFPIEHTVNNELGIDKEGLFLQESGAKAFIIDADELEEIIGMTLWESSIVDVYVPEQQLISNPALYYVVVESGGTCCIDSSFVRRIVVITKARMKVAQRELEEIINENISQ